MIPATEYQRRDLSTRGGTEWLAAKVRQYWADRGRKVETTVCYTDHKDDHNKQIFGIVSDLVDGMPR